MAAQLARVEAYCTAMGWELADVIVDDGVSTRKRRPGLEQVREQVRAGEVGRVVIVRLDRLGRSLSELLAVCDEMTAHGCQLVSIADGFDTGTSTGRFLRNILASVAELEREMVSERTRDAMAVAMANGVRMGRPTVVTDDVVSMILEAKGRGLGASATCRELSALGVSPPTGSRWHPSTVQRICQRHGS